MPETKDASAERLATLLITADQIAKRTASTVEIKPLISDFVELICDGLGYLYTGVYLVDESRQNLVLRAGYGEAGRAMIEEGYKLTIGKDTPVVKSFETAESLVINDVESEDDYPKNPHLSEVKSEVVLPLSVGGSAMGAVTVQSESKNTFDEHEVTALEIMANQIAFAVRSVLVDHELQLKNSSLIRMRTHEDVAASMTEALQWIGNKTLPIMTALPRMMEILEGEAVDVEALKADLALVEDNTRLIAEVRDTLLGPAGERQMRPALVADVVQASAFFTGVPDEILSINVAKNTPLALTDTTQLARVLSYLFVNAMEADATHISANITPTFGRDHVAISIADDGEGIAPDDLETIWKPFITSKGPEHSGLGLPACLNLIYQLDGLIMVDSEAGKGAVFTIVLPTASEDAAVDLSHAPDNILFIDEEEDAWALFAANVLKLAGKNVVVQESPAGAASADLILIDEALTTMRVEKVVEELKEAGVAGKAVVVTAALDVDRATRYMQAGVRDVALKPYTYTGLSALMDYEQGEATEQPTDEA